MNWVQINIQVNEEWRSGPINNRSLDDKSHITVFILTFKKHEGTRAEKAF